MVWQILARAASVYAKDKVADWTEGSRFEGDTDQWDNPAWYDYLAAAASGYSGNYSEYVKAGANIAKGVGKYNEDRDNFSWGEVAGDAMGTYGDFGGYGSDSNIFKKGRKYAYQMPTEGEKQDIESYGTIGSDPNDPNNDYPGFFYKPDLTTDLYQGKFNGRNQGNINTIPTGNEWKTNPMFTNPATREEGVDQSTQDQMKGQLGGYDGADFGSIGGGVLDIIFGRDFNERPNDPYWIHDEGMGTNAENNASSSPGWIDKMFG